MRTESESHLAARSSAKTGVRPLLLPGLLGCACVLAVVSGVWACSVPVFRYALEHWQPDAYVLTVFHRGPLENVLREGLFSLAPQAPDGRPVYNLQVDAIDISGPLSSESERLWQSLAAQSLPYVVLQAPPTKTGSGATVWSGPASEAVLSGVLESPLRKQIARELLEGESVVWVLLESGRAEQDDAAWSTLRSTLAKLQESLHLPAIEAADAAELTIAPESLKLSFTAHRLSSDDASEVMFRELLRSVEPDLRDPALRDQPMAFPLFGRGRALYALIGEGINPATIEEACRFLTAGCQCTVKQQNPGIDLLFAVAWSRLVEPTTPLKETPPLVGLAGFGDADAASMPAALPFAAGPEVSASDSATPDAASGAPASSAAPAAGGQSAAPSNRTANSGGDSPAMDAPLSSSVWLIVSIVLIGTVYVVVRWRQSA